MRSVRADDHWRRAIENERGFRLVSVTVEGKPPLADTTVDLAPGLTVICGLNGVGKSTLLRLVEGALNGVESIAGRCRSELVSHGAFELALTVDHQSKLRSLGDEAQGGPEKAIMLDAFDACAKAVALGRDTNLPDLVATVESRLWDDDERSLASYVVGRVYDQIAVFELDTPTPLDEGFGESVVPYFKVIVGGLEYDTFTMGLGELAALSLLWRLWGADPQSVVVVEEPETFLSSRSTAAFLDVVARAIEQRRLYAVVSTHAPEVIGRVPVENVRVVAPSLNGREMAVHTPATRAQLDYALGAPVGVYRLALVEDRVARLVVGELLARFSGLWGEAVDVQIAGSVQAVESICRTMPSTPRMSLVGVLDGDQLSREFADSSWPMFVLPGGDNPDRVLRNAATSRPDRFALTLQRDGKIVAGALQLTAGLDAHDWASEMARTLGTDDAAIVRAAIGCWLDDARAALEVAGFVEAVVSALSG